MPPTRRRSNNPTNSTTARSQSTLSFNNKPSRVTKSTAAALGSKKEAKLNEKAEAQLEHSDESVVSLHPPTTEQPATRNVDIEDDEISKPAEEVQQSEEEVSSKPIQPTPKTPTPSPSLQIAQSLSNKQIKSYYAAILSARLTAPIHQQSLTLHEKILRHFDLSSQYGPCIGISRLNRWKRAETLGLEPPVEVLGVLLREEEKSKGSAGEGACGRMAYIDELAGGRRVEGIVE